MAARKEIGEMVERARASLSVRQGARALGRGPRALSRDGPRLPQGVIAYGDGLQRRGHPPLRPPARRGERHRRASHRTSWPPSWARAGRAVAAPAPLAAAGQCAERHLAGAAVGASRRLHRRADRPARGARSRRSRQPLPPSARSPRSPSICPSAIRMPSSIAARSRSCSALDDASLWPALLVRWELMLLQDLGFGLDLSECAATGTDADLVFVSPRSGRAVSRDAGQPYCDRLLKLPRFLAGGGCGAGAAGCRGGLRPHRPFPRARCAEPARTGPAASPRAPGRPVGACARTGRRLSRRSRCAKRGAWERESRRLIRVARSSRSICARRWKSATSLMRSRPSCTGRCPMCATG